jgi:XapX domain-containing protein
MKIYMVSLGAGVLVGIIYSLLNVRSPAPPLIALVGLLGILVGEQLIPVGKHILAGSTIFCAYREARCASHLFGMLPGRHQDGALTTTEQVAEKTP